jgi:hypothetical protein
MEAHEITYVVTVGLDVLTLHDKHNMHTLSIKKIVLCVKQVRKYSPRDAFLPVSKACTTQSYII